MFRTDIYDHHNDYDQVVETSVDMNILSNSLHPELIDLTQERVTIDIPSEDEDQEITTLAASSEVLDAEELYRRTERRSILFEDARYTQFPSDEELQAAELANSLEPRYSDIEDEDPVYNGDLP